MIAVSVIMATILLGLVIVVISNMMARTNVQDPSEFTQVVMDETADVDSALPQAGLTFANRLRSHTIVQDDATSANLNRVEVADNQSVTARGILTQDQSSFRNEAQTLDETDKIPYLWKGNGRCFGIAPIAKHDWLVVGANGFARSYDALVAGDTPNMRIGRATCGITVTGDIVDGEFDFGANGGV
jgi:hypothetical protein